MTLNAGLTHPTGNTTQMKLSLILVSVNLAATLPIATAGMAIASDQAISDKTAWLKSSLAQMDVTPLTKKPLRARALSLSMPAPKPTITLHSRGVKLRPFVPNRKLPSQHELDVQFIAQSAKYAPQQDLVEQTARMAPGSDTLSGRVSEVYPGMKNSVANYGNIGYVKQSSSRVVPGQVASAPGQIRQFKGAKRTKYVPVQSAPAQASDQQAWAADYPTLGDSLSQTQQPAAPAPTFQPMQRFQQFLQTSHANQPAAQMPGITPDEQSIIDRMLAQTRAQNQNSAGMMNASAPSSAGPPPFPLSLLPQDSLKSMMGGAHRSPQSTQAAPSSYFGSWHGNASPPGIRAGGFQLHSPTRLRLASGAHNIAHTTNSQAKHAHFDAYSHNSSQSTTHAISQLRRIHPQEMRVASYPPYPRMAGAY